VGARGRGWGKSGEKGEVMTHLLYAHMNKVNKKRKNLLSNKEYTEIYEPDFKNSVNTWPDKIIHHGERLNTCPIRSEINTKYLWLPLTAFLC
jgi:hypothetical protein